MTLEESSEASQVDKSPGTWVDKKAMANAAAIAVVTTVIVLFATDKVRESEMDGLSEKIEKLDTTVTRLQDSVATHEDVVKARERAKQDAKSYTDTRVSDIQPVLTRLTVVLERLDEDRKEAKEDRRLIHNDLQELRQSIGAAQ